MIALQQIVNQVLVQSVLP